MNIKALYFDMDDTLHSFSRSAGASMKEVYKHIVQKHSLPLEELKQTYSKIIAQTEKDAFFDGRTSKEYRTERFAKLLASFKIQDESTIRELLDIYAETLERNMRLSEDVRDTLIRLSQKKPLYIVSEGPSDAQRRAIELLGLTPYFQDVFISGEAKKVKETGELFKYALEQGGHKPEEVVLIGDSYIRDVIGGLIAGLYVVWLNRENKQLSSGDKQPHAQISDIQELEGILEKHFSI